MNREIEHLVEGLLQQARSEAWKFFAAAPQQLDRQELESLAYTGLAMAAAKWDDYCERREFDPGCGAVPCERPDTCGASRYFGAYALRRMRGAVLDAMRQQDWVPRSVRSRHKALREAGQDLGKTEEQLSAETGLDVQQIRDTLAGVARRPVSMDAAEGAHIDVAEDVDVESQVLVRTILGAAVSTLERLPEETRIVIALRYHQQRDLKEIARLMNRTEAEVSALHVQGILAVRQAMAVAAQEENR